MTSRDRPDFGRTYRRRPSLRLLLTLSFLVLLLSAVGVTGFLLIRNSRRGVEEVTAQLRRELAGHAHDYVSQFLETPHRVNRLNADLVRRGSLDVSDSAALGRHFWYQRGEFEDLSFLFFATADGGAAGAGRNSDGVVVVDTTDVEPERGLVSGVRREYRAGASGDRGELLKETSGFDARRRPWFEAAVARRGPVWSEVYPFFAEGTLAVAASEPVYGSGGELLGVLGADFGLDRLGEFLRGLRVGETGRVFIVERSSGLLVASSSPQAPVAADPRTGEGRRLGAAESSEPLIAATARHLQERFGADLSRVFGGQLSFRLAGERQLVDLAPLTDPRGIDWLIVVAVPEADFAGQIAASTRTTLWLCLAALAVALLAAILVARSLSRPLLDLSRASRALAGGRLDQRVEVGGVGEIGELAHSFNAMAGQLQSSFEELESRVAERTAELSAAKEVAVVANQRKTDFLSTVSHEVRTPLAAILGYADLLLSGDTAREDLHQWVATIRDNGEHLGALVDDLLDLNRIESGVLELDDEWVDLRALLARLHSTMAARAQAAGLVLRLSAPAPVPLRVRVDPMRLGQVLLNLLANAVKYTPEGSVTLAIAAAPGPSGTEASADTPAVPGPARTTLELRVVDTGVGIAADERGRLFEPFVRLAGARQGGSRPEGTRQEGVGLGLAIARRLVDRMGGTIEVLSQLGRGSEFVVQLPVESGAEWGTLGSDWSTIVVGGGSQNRLAALAADSPQLAGRVLVADDSHSLRALVVEILRRWGLECKSVADGHEAVAAVAGAPSGGGFDVVVLDWQMPRLDGLGAIAELRQRGFDVPVVMLTAAASATDRDRSLAAGCVAHVAKPLDFGRLREVLGELLPAAPREVDRAAGPDERELTGLVDRYARGLPAKLAEVRSVAAAGDEDELQRIAHRLAGTAGSFGFAGVAELAAAIEDAARRGEVGSIGSLLDRLAGRIESELADTGHGPRE